MGQCMSAVLLGIEGGIVGHNTKFIAVQFNDWFKRVIKVIRIVFLIYHFF